MANQKTSPDVNSVLEDVNKMITLKYLHSIHVCSHKCEEMDTEHTRLLIHRSEVAF